MKFIIAFILVAAVIAGLLLTLRTSRNAGIPGRDVIDRAAERAREQQAADKDD